MVYSNNAYIQYNNNVHIQYNNNVHIQLVALILTEILIQNNIKDFQNLKTN
jgi:hypothetical protein